MSIQLSGSASLSDTKIMMPRESTTQLNTTTADPTAPIPSLAFDRTVLTRVFCFIVYTHVVVDAILVYHGLPLPYFPRDQHLFIAMLLIGAGVITYVMFGGQIVLDLMSVLRARPTVPVRRRFFRWGRTLLLMCIFAVAFDLILLNNAGLKPAIPIIHPVWFDGGLERLERWLFGGVLPTEWLVQHTGPRFMYAMDRIYGLFGGFLVVSLVLELQHQGTVGGGRMVLALCASLTITLLCSLVYPTQGPLFVHPEWFEPYANLGSLNLAQYLKTSIQDYATGRGVLDNTVSGISAMPSYHVAGWTCGLWCWRRLPKWLGAAALLLWLVNWLSTVALGWHYALDGLGGILAAVVGIVLAKYLIPDTGNQRTKTGPSLAVQR